VAQHRASELGEEALDPDLVLMCTNTMYLMADAVAEAINIPLFHIADPTGNKSKQRVSKALAHSGQHSRWSKTFIRDA
jgi:aspartate racemase